MANNQKSTTPYIFPQTQESTVLPDPLNFFSSNLVSNPLPTNSFFQNFVLKKGDQPEYIHPYLIKSSNSSLSLSYPSHSFTSAAIYQVFNADLTISSKNSSNGKHTISSFSDLSVTLDIPSSNLSFFLVRGSPFLTVSVTQSNPLSITTIHAITSFSSNDSFTKFNFQFNNGQKWLIYASSPIKLSQNTPSGITSNPFSGIIRIALLPDSNMEATLDMFSSCYPVSGDALIKEPFCVEYNWETKGSGDLLLLAHPLHVQLLSNKDSDDVTVLDDFKYKSIDGDLVAVVGSKWILKANPISVTWHSTRGVKEESKDEIVKALVNDVEGLNASSMGTFSSYFYGKLIARAARLALIAEEIFFYDVIPKVRNFLKQAIEPWLDGTFKQNGFLHDHKWGGIITYKGTHDSSDDGDFGFGIYNDHQYHLGYFLYAIAVLTKIDPKWGRKYKAKAYSLMEDFMNLDTKSNPNYTKLRCFDLYKLHSWAAGLTEFSDGRNHESTSQAVNAYYAAALMGMAYGDVNLMALGTTLTSLEIHAAQMWFHVKEDGNIYEDVFTQENRIMGILWSNKRDSGLWFVAHAEWREYRLGIHLLPLLPISEALFSNIEYVIELVEWTFTALNREGALDAWKGFAYALEGIYDNESAMQKIRSLKGFDDGNSLTNLLWWIHSRGDGVDDE